MIDKMKEVAMRERDQHEGLIEEKNREINQLIENKNKEVSNVIQDRKRSLDEKSKEVSKIHQDKEKEIKKLANALSDLKEELVQSTQLNVELETKKRSLEGKLESVEKEAEARERNLKLIKQEMRMAEDDKGRMIKIFRNILAKQTCKNEYTVSIVSFTIEISI